METRKSQLSPQKSCLGVKAGTERSSWWSLGQAAIRGSHNSRLPFESKSAFAITAKAKDRVLEWEWPSQPSQPGRRCWMMHPGSSEQTEKVEGDWFWEEEKWAGRQNMNSEEMGWLLLKWIWHKSGRIFWASNWSRMGVFLRKTISSRP